MQHFQNAGNSLEPLLLPINLKRLWGPRLIAEPNSKNVEDWTIRSQGPKPVIRGYGQGSTTTC